MSGGFRIIIAICNANYPSKEDLQKITKSNNCYSHRIDNVFVSKILFQTCFVQRLCPNRLHVKLHKIKQLIVIAYNRGNLFHFVGDNFYSFFFFFFGWQFKINVIKNIILFYYNINTLIYKKLKRTALNIYLVGTNTLNIDNDQKHICRIISMYYNEVSLITTLTSDIEIISYLKL